MNPRNQLLAACALACLVTVPTGIDPSFAQGVSPQGDDLPRAAIRRGGAGADGGHGAHGAAALAAEDICPTGDVCYDLRIRYATGRIRNPNFAESDPRGYDNVKLRSYVGEVVDAAGAVAAPLEFVAPQVELRPGDTFRMTLHNDLAKAEDMGLPWRPPCAAAAPTHNDPHCANFNLTNLHAHGLWVSPVGNSDNVLLTINPGVSFTYEYNIPQDHPAGTFWYHSHRHGSTGPQVASGMAGTLIIRGDRQPQLAGQSWAAPGDVDVILPRPGMEDRAEAGPRFPERVMLFQQIVYACRNPDGTIKRVDPAVPTSTWACDPANANIDPFDPDNSGGDVARIGDIDTTRVGTVEPGPILASGVDTTFDLMGFNAWPQSRRHTAINGTVQKVFASATTGSVERWRLIDAGVRQTIKLQIRKAASPAAAAGLFANALPEDVTEAQLIEVCSGAPLEVVGLATDGLTRPVLHPRTETWLQPGYREDILVSFPEEGTYCVLNGAVSAADNVNALEGETAVLGLVSVSGPAAGGTASERIRDALVASAQHGDTFADASVRAQVVADLQDGGKLSAFLWNRTIPRQELTGRQTVGFQFGGGQFAIGGLRGDLLGGGGITPDNPQEYDPDRIDRLLPLGGVEEWVMTSFAAGHPFHIHVNPFEIIEVLRYQPDAQNPDIDPLDMRTWVDVSGPGSGTEYAGLKGAWKDVIFVQPGYIIRTRTRYERYIGDFVLHCHILDHEDQGMMQNVRTALTDGRGGLESHGH